jgi:chromosome segregation ATPase
LKGGLMNEAYIYGKIMEHDELLTKHEQRLNSLMTRDELNARFDEILAIVKRLDEERLAAAHRMDNMDARFDRIDKRFDQVDLRMDRMETEIGSLKVSVSRIETHLGIK